MKVSTTSTSTATLAVPFTCRCPYCGETFQGQSAVEAAGYAFTGGYAAGAKGQMMNLTSGMRASANMSFELEYAEKRLEHYRGIVADGKLKRYLKTGKADKADTFRVEAGSALEQYLKSGPNKTQLQAQQDRGRLTDFPYRWKVFTKSTAVKCPQCGKVQPWCESVDAETAGFKAFFLGFIVCFLGMVPFMAGVKLHGAQVVLALLPIAAWIVTSILVYRRLRRKQLNALAALPWNADDLPRFDEEFLAQAKAEYGQKAGAPF